MIHPKRPTKKELELLQEHRKKSASLLIRDRAHAILLAVKEYAAPEIAEILDRARETIEKWIGLWNTIRLASLFPEYEGNTNASKLTKEQRTEIQKTLENPPESGGLPSAFWSIKSLKKYLNASYGVVYRSNRSYHHVFTLSDYSFKLPDGLNRRRDDAFVEERMKEVRLEVAQKKSEGYIPFAADESSLCFATTLRRAWIKKGQKTILKVESQKTRQHYFGALNLITQKHELISLNWQDTENMIDALRELTRRYPNKKLCIVWDNARWHRSKDLRALLGKGKEFEHIHFIWMPPYAPDKNPEEHVWKVGKTEVGNAVTETFDELKHFFEASISNKCFNYRL